jgi:hypothetical protein
MPQGPSKPTARRLAKSQQPSQISFAETLRRANRQAHEKANRRGERRALKSVRAAIAATDFEEDELSPGWLKRLLRAALALVLLPLCWVTTWTFLSQFSQAAVYGGFWQTAEFWYFTVGVLVMVGWFWSGLLQAFFLYLYVLGHELTHAVFVLLYRGKVSDFYVSADGGYITTNKSNWVIALSPYFVPFWAVVIAAVYGLARCFVEVPQRWEYGFYAAMGLTWAFHMIWTLWMIPRDQPDLRENGTFLSLVIIYLANLLILIGLMCVAADSPVANVTSFGMEWLRHAATWGDRLVRGLIRGYAELRAFGRV